MTTDPSPGSDPVSAPVQPAERLRALLLDAKPDDAQWQDEAGRMVSLLAVRFPQEVDAAAALVIVALMGLAVSQGVKEAKKRTLKLTRWVDAPAPALTSLGSLEEQRAAVNALAKLRAPWAQHYAAQALCDAELPVGLLPDLLRWARTASIGLPEFMGGPLTNAISACTDVGRALALLKDSLKLLRPSEPVHAPALASALKSLVASVTALPGIASPRDEDKEAVALLQAGFAALELVWQAVPAALLQPALLTATRQLCDAMKVQKKSAPTSVDMACLATLGLMADGARRFGAEAIRQWRPLLPLWQAAYPGFDGQLAAAAGGEPALAQLTADQAVTDQNSNPADRYAAEEAFAALLPAWSAFARELTDPSRVSSLGNMLLRAAGTAGVEPFGVVGERLDYDPLAHHLSVDAPASPAHVEVARPGVLARRADGSTRILVQALVKPL